MRILPLSIPLNENEIKIKNYSPSSLSIPQGALQLQLNCLKLKIGKLNFWARKDLFPSFLREKNIKMWMQTSFSSSPFLIKPRPLIKLTKPKWNCQPISWPRPHPHRPFVSRLDAKQNSNSGYWPLWREWVGRCPVTKSIRKTTSSRWHVHSIDQRPFTAIHPSNEQAAKHFVLSSHAISPIQPLMK
jgi:hypothetical protein